MDRRQFFQGSSALVAIVTAGPALAAAGSEDTKLRALLDAFWEEDLDASPELVTALGLDTGKRAAQRGKLGDASSAGRAKWVAATKARLTQLATIDSGKLSPASRIDKEVVAYAYGRIVDGGETFTFGEAPAGFSYAPYSPYVISQLSGAYQSVPDFLDSNHPVKTAADAEAYLARLEAFPSALDANTDTLKADAARGVLAPDFALDATLAQLKKLRAPAPAEHGLTTSLAGRAKEAKIDGDWSGRAAAIVETKVYPAVDRQIAAVAELRAKATSDAGIWKIPGGDAFYAGALAFQTTTTKTPQVFRTLPKAPVEIVRVPPEIEDGAPNGYATPPTLDGSRPGRFYINLKDTAEWPKFTLPTLTYHEALPGHQWDGAIALMSTDTPMLRRVGLGFSACSEGWALYAEQLADELGSYEGDPLGKIGFLQSLQFRAVRLVVDTGMHAKRWSREKATDYMVETTGMPRNRVQREIDRYCIWPGQACS